jgi:hypothetical protein
MKVTSNCTKLSIPFSGYRSVFQGIKWSVREGIQLQVPNIKKGCSYAPDAIHLFFVPGKV